MKLEFLPCQLSILNKVMISASQAQIACKNPRVNSLLLQIAQQKTSLECTLISKVKQDRKMYHSNSAKTSRNSFIQRPLFNNKTREGELLDMEFKPVPYLFVPGFKNDTFIMPDRVFQKGKAGKRFFIKMKDTAICSFRSSQGEGMSQVLHKKEKQQTIISRQNEQYNKLINQNDGKLKAEANRWFLKTRKRFDPAHGRQLFSECEPMLQPKDPQAVQIRKTSLSKTFDFRNKWRPATRGAQVFSATTSVSNRHQHYASSVR